VVVRCYIVPETGDGTTQALGRRPAYIREAIGSDDYRTLPYRASSTPSHLVAVDVTAGQHTTINGSANVISTPSADLSTTIANNTVRNTVRNALEARDIPAHWVNTGATYRSVLRGVACIILLAQRLSRVGQLLPNGITMDSTLGDLTQGQRDALEAAVVSLGWDPSGATGSTTLRAFVRGVSAQHLDDIFVGAEIL
jgi:hypothetical protein